MRNILLAQAFFASKKNRNPTNIYETDERYLIEIETPYFTETDLTIERVANGLRVRGERSVALPKPFQKEGSTTHRVDRLIRLKENFENKNVEASLDDGILHIAIEKQPATTIPITIS